MATFPADPSPQLASVYYNDGTVHAMVARGLSLEEIIVVLADEKQRLVQKVVKLSLIAPRRIGDKIWHCPDHLVPEEPRLL